MIGSIYRATNRINGKSYIGHDKNWPRRQIEHKHAAFVKASPTIFHKALRKYGWEVFDWEIICQSKDPVYLSNEMEPYFIAYYDTFMPNGYNMTKGGDGVFGRVISEETRLKMSEALKGKKWTKDMHNKMVGRKQTPEHIHNVRMGLLKNTRKDAKPVMIETIYGSIIFGSKSQASRSIKDGNNNVNWVITQLLKGKKYSKPSVIISAKFI